MEYLPQQIAICIIAWNNLFFVRRFVDQIRILPNPIIILDNHSSYQPLLEYYHMLKAELKDRQRIMGTRFIQKWLICCLKYIY